MKKIQNIVGGSKLMVVDDLSPEDNAMLQALYSRSAESAEVHIDKIAKTGSGKFMDSFYVGYGHKSIADCGTTTMFIEGVSTLAAKAVQDWPLYCGQETSTRYIDMSKQRIEDPVGTARSKRILDRWMEFYTSSQTRMSEIIRQRYPQKSGEKDDIYERAVKARTFDSLRGFLPAGITTQLSWHSNLRQAGDHLLLLSKHPAKEIREIGKTLQGLLSETYKSSGFAVNVAAVSGVDNRDKEAEDARRAWEQSVADSYTYPSVVSRGKTFRSTIRNEDLAEYEIIKTRPRGCVLPHFLSDLGQLTFTFNLDFGSFRDIQRHRNGVCRMPLLTTNLGFEPWYLDQLDADLGRAAKTLIEEQTAEIEQVSNSAVERQYYVALGFLCPCSVTYALPAAVYVMDLRSGKLIHPTLRRVIHGMIQDFRAAHPTVALHVDLDPDDWDVRRGKQTILAK